MSNCASRFTIKVAGINVEVKTPSFKVTPQLRMFISHENPEVSVTVDQEDVDLLIRMEEEFGKINKDMFLIDEQQHIRLFYNEVNIPYLRSMAIYIKIADALLSHNTLLMHGAVVAYGDGSVMFCGPSGMGKTTHAKLWLNRLENAHIVNGDKPLIKISEKCPMACGTPWCGKENYGTNEMIPLRAIVLMERSELNSIEEVKSAKGYAYLLKQTYIPSDLQKARKVLSLLMLLYNRVHVFHFKFNNYRDDCFDVAYGKLSRAIMNID